MEAHHKMGGKFGQNGLPAVGVLFSDRLSMDWVACSLRIWIMRTLLEHKESPPAVTGSISPINGSIKPNIQMAL